MSRNLRPLPARHVAPRARGTAVAEAVAAYRGTRTGCGDGGGFGRSAGSG